MCLITKFNIIGLCYWLLSIINIYMHNMRYTWNSILWSISSWINKCIKLLNRLLCSSIYSWFYSNNDLYFVRYWSSFMCIWLHTGFKFMYWFYLNYLNNMCHRLLLNFISNLYLYFMFILKCNSLFEWNCCDNMH